MYSTLNDLDALVHSVRNNTSRGYIEEAVRAYSAGAYRAALVSTWIATAFDLFSKLRELALGGDRAAHAYIETFDRAVENEYIPQLLKIEGELLATASKDFQLLSAHELQALQRLQDDRHLCAHPAFVREEELFVPEPELVRTHIVHAVRYVLSQPPVQSKAALSRIEEDIESEAYPTDNASIESFLYAKYLGRCKESLVRNLTIALVARLLDRAHPPDSLLRRRLLGSLAAISRRSAAIYEPAFVEALQKYAIPRIEQLPSLLSLLSTENRTWRLLSEPVRLGLRTLLQGIARDGTFSLDCAEGVGKSSTVPEIGPEVLAAFESCDEPTKAAILEAAEAKGLFVSSCFRTYGAAKGFRQAEHLADVYIKPLAKSLSAEQIAELLEIVKSNTQIHWASGTDSTLAMVYRNQPNGPWQAFISWAEEQRGNVYLGTLRKEFGIVEDF